MIRNFVLTDVNQKLTDFINQRYECHNRAFISISHLAFCSIIITVISSFQIILCTIMLLLILYLKQRIFRLQTSLVNIIEWKKMKQFTLHLIFFPSSNLDVSLIHLIKQTLIIQIFLWYTIYGTSLTTFHRLHVQLILNRIPRINTV